MQIHAQLAAALLLVIPSLVGAAPTTIGNGIQARDAANVETSNVYSAAELFTRDGMTCNPPKPKDDKERQKQNEALAKMRAATQKAHAGENMCKSPNGPADFNKSKNKQVRERIKQKCIDGYTQYVNLH